MAVTRRCGARGVSDAVNVSDPRICPNTTSADVTRSAICQPLIARWTALTAATATFGAAATGTDVSGIDEGRIDDPEIVVASRNVSMCRSTVAREYPVTRWRY